MEDEAQVVESPFMDIHYIEIEPNQAQRHEEKGKWHLIPQWIAINVDLLLTLADVHCYRPCRVWR